MGFCIGERTPFSNISNWNLGVKATPTTSRSKASDDSARSRSAKRPSARVCRRMCSARFAARSRTARRSTRTSPTSSPRAEGLGRRARRDPLHALVPADDRHHRAEARLVSLADGRRPRGRRVHGKELIKGEPDARAFPSGGMRATFEARGYTAWDSDEPALALVMQTARRSSSRRRSSAGPARRSTRRLRSSARCEAISKQAVRLLKLFGSKSSASSRPRPRAGILPDQPAVLLSSAGPHHRRPDALRRQAPEGTGARGSVLRRDTRARARVHDGRRA